MPNPFADLPPANVPPPGAPAQEAKTGFTEQALLDESHISILKEIEGQIAFLRKIQRGLEVGISEKNSDQVAAMIDRCTFRIEDALSGDIHSDDIEKVQAIVKEVLTGYLSQDQISVDDAKALRAASKDLVGMIKQYRDMAGGFLVQVEFSDERYEKLCKVLFRRVPPQYLKLMVEDLKEYAPTVGQLFSIDI